MQGQSQVQSHMHLLANAVLIGAACSVVLALVQALGIWDDASWINRTSAYRRPGGNLSQPNQLATLIIMGLASLAYLYEARRLGSAVAVTLFGVLILGVSVTESRSGVLSSIVLAVWWFARKRMSGFKTPNIAIVAGSALLFILLLAWPTFLEYVQAGGLVTDSKLAGISASAGTRLIVWPQLIEAALQRPWLGWGLREVSTAHNAVLHAYATGEPFTYAHNIVLDLAVGTGLPFTLLCVTSTSIWLFRRIKSARTLLPWYCIALILPVLVHSMFEFPFAYAYFLFPTLFTVGLLEGLLEPTKSFSVNWWFAATGAVVLTAVMAWSVVEYISLEEDFRVARFEALRVGRTPADYERPTTRLLSQLAALNEVSRVIPAPGMNSERIELIRKVALRFPWFATQNRYALSLALNGNPDEAVRQLKVMRAMHGEKAFAGIRANWKELAETKYPQLAQLPIP